MATGDDGADHRHGTTQLGGAEQLREDAATVLTVRVVTDCWNCNQRLHGHTVIGYQGLWPSLFVVVTV